MTIDRGGTVDNIGTLTVNINSNAVNLYGGTLGLTSAIYSNGLLFTAGDGAQLATLKSLAGGTASFLSGLLINTNATIKGIGTVNGGDAGVTLTNGATINPGLAGSGTLTIGGSNLTWNAGAKVLVEIVNMAGGPGSGYGTLNVSSQLALVADVGSSSLVIRLSTRGVEAANFSTNASYNLLIASVTSLTDFDASKFTVNTDDFLNPVAGTWSVMRLDNNLYVTYRPTVEAGTDYTWTAPSNGNWTVDGNWVGGFAPPASSPGMRLTFGGGASDPLYIANNNNVGAFQLNRLVLTNANAAMTNILTGNPLQFWNADAAIEQGGSGSFNISGIMLSSSTNLVLRGMGSGMVILTNTTVAGSLTKQGASTAVLNGTNSFIGPLVVNGAGGTLRIDNLNALSTNAFVVFNGTLSIPSVMTTFGNLATYRSAVVSGSAATWTNGVGLTIGSNAQVTVDAGGRLAINGALTVADRGTVANSLTVTNGGQIYCTAASIVGNVTSNNSASVGGGGALWHAGNTAVTIGSGAGATNNTILIDGLGVECGARLTNVATMTVGNGAGSGWNSLLLTQGGQLFCTTPTIGNASSNNTVVISGGGSLWNGGAGALSIGLAAGGVSNLLRIDGLGARMTNMGNVTLGSAVGSGWNTLIVTNGGQLSSLGAIAIGSTSSNNAVVISGGGALWNNPGALTIGSGAGMTNNTLLIDGQNMDGGAMMTNVNNIVIGSIGDYNTMRVNNMGRIYLAGSFSIGNGNGSRSNQLIVEQGGKMKGTALANSYVGLAGGYANLLVIRDAGSVFDLGTGASYVFIGGSTTLSTGTGNVMRVENGGVFTNGAIRIGASDATHYDVGNLLVVTNGLVYASGLASVVGYGFNSCYATALVVGASSLWNGGAQAINVGWGALAMSNTLWIDAALVTNVAGFNLGQALAQTNSWNQMVITNGAQVYANGATVIGASTYGTNNTALVTGPGTLWNQGGANLTLGGGARTASNNTVRIDQGALLDAIGTLTINSNNVLHLRGGTLGVTATTFTNGTLFTIGDGVQDATLKALGGTLAFNSGLLLTNKNTLTGLGTISGGAVGVVLTNGATLDPGISGAGSLVIGGSNLTWKGGAVYNVDITNLNLGAGNGWDLVTVNTQLLFTAGTPNYVIRMDSKGSQPVGFEPNRDYNIRIMTVAGTVTGFDPSIITVKTNDFVGGTAPWVVSNVANTLYLVYRGATPGSAASDIWSVPNNGNWDVNENWVGGTAPGAGGDSTTILGFGDNGTRYNSTNNLGAFRLNQMQVSSASLVTNLITGNPLIFTNNGATLPRMDFLTGAGAFTISNALILSTDTVFGGNAFVGGTVTLGGAITNQGTMTKQGTWTLVLSNANNNLSGPVMVDSPDGVLRVDQVNALNGSGPVTVSNGLLWVKWPSAGFYFANAKDNRRGWVTSGAVWSNVCAGENNQSGFALGSSNVQITIDGGKMYWTVRFGAFASGSSYGTVLVTNGGQLNLSAPTYGAYVGSGSTNCTMTITGPNTLFNQGGGSGGLTVSEGSGSGNILRVDNGALATNITTITVGGINGNNDNSLIVTNGGKLFNSGFTVAKTASANNRFIVTGSNSFWQQLVAANQMAIGTASGTNNLFLLDQGAIATNIRFSAFANTGSNLITVANGGKLFLTTGYPDAGTLAVGPFANGNLTTVTGSGSVWNGMGMILTLAGGNTCSWNRLSVESGGLITNFATVNVASGLNSLNNSLVVDGGILQATTLAFNNLLPNDFTLTGGGRVTLSSFALSNSNQRLNLNGGEFRVQSALVTNWGSFTVGDGSQTAMLSLLPGITTNRFYDGLVITNQATLTGQGTIQATTTVFGVLSPGMTLGSLTNIGGLTLKTSSESRFEIMTNSTPGVGWDYLVVTNGTLTLGGTLKPVLTGGFVPTNTQSYVIMTNAGPLGVSGEFFNGGNNATIAAYSNDLSKVMGVFRLVISNQCVILNSFLPNSSLQRGSVFRVY